MIVYLIRKKNTSVVKEAVIRVFAKNDITALIDYENRPKFKEIPHMFS